MNHIGDATKMVMPLARHEIGRDGLPKPQLRNGRWWIDSMPLPVCKRPVASSNASAICIGLISGVLIIGGLLALLMLAGCNRANRTEPERLGNDPDTHFVTVGDTTPGPVDVFHDKAFDGMTVTEKLDINTRLNKERREHEEAVALLRETIVAADDERDEQASLKRAAEAQKLELERNAHQQQLDQEERNYKSMRTTGYALMAIGGLLLIGSMFKAVVPVLGMIPPTGAAAILVAGLLCFSIAPYTAKIGRTGELVAAVILWSLAGGVVVGVVVYAITKLTTLRGVNRKTNKQSKGKRDLAVRKIADGKPEEAAVLIAEADVLAHVGKLNYDPKCIEPSVDATRMAKALPAPIERPFRPPGGEA